MEAHRTAVPRKHPTGPAQPAFADLPEPWLKTVVREQLSPCDRLSLFAVSSGLAAAVLRHAACVQLTLHAAWEVVPRSSKQAHSALSRIMALSSGVNLHVVLVNGLPAQWAALPDRISDLTLTKCYITSNLLLGLKLQQCSSLHTLTLGKGTSLDYQQFSNSQLMTQTHKSWLPPSLTSLRVMQNCTEACATAVMQLLSTQLMRLHVKRAVMQLPASCQSLTHFHTTDTLTDSTVRSLAALSSLAHVTCGSLHLQEDHVDGQHRWTQLEVTDTVSTLSLSKLPLASIQRVVIHDIEATPFQEEEEVNKRLAMCQTLVCVPKRCLYGWLAANQPCAGVFTIGGHCSAAMLQLCIQGLAHFDACQNSSSSLDQELCSAAVAAHAVAAQGDAAATQAHAPVERHSNGCALFLGSFDVAQAADQLLPCLPHLPQSISMLMLGLDTKSAKSHQRYAGTRFPTDQHGLQCWEQVLAAVPAHVHVVLAPGLPFIGGSLSPKLDLDKIVHAHPGGILVPDGLWNDKLACKSEHVCTTLSAALCCKRLHTLSLHAFSVQ